MDDLLLKATPELLEGWCGPVVLGGSTDTVWDGFCVWDEDIHGGHGTWEPPRMGIPIHLDLARAECRDRVARVVLAHVRSSDAAWPHWAGSVTPYDLFGSRLVDAQALLAVAREVLHAD